MRQLKLAVPDLISNSYFPAVAAVALGSFRDEGLEVALELVFPVDKAYRALREGAIDLVGGSAHSVLSAFPEWKGAKLLCAQAQGMYWFLVVRAALRARRGDVGIIKGLTIGAAPWVDLGLRAVLKAAGIDPARDRVTIKPVQGVEGAGVSFGVTAARALEDGAIDAFWANGMGAEVAVRRGAGTVVLDVRRGDGPAGCFDYTMSALTAADRLLEREPDVARAAVRAVTRAQQALKQDLRLATEVGRTLFPEYEASLIAELIRRDLPYYDPAISPAFVGAMNRFARDVGILRGDPAYDQVVAAECQGAWRA